MLEETEGRGEGERTPRDACTAKTLSHATPLYGQDAGGTGWGGAGAGGKDASARAPKGGVARPGSILRVDAVPRERQG